MKAEMAQAQARGDHSFSRFGPESNLFEELEDLFRTYGDSGTGRIRRYLHDEAEAEPYGPPSAGTNGGASTCAGGMLV